MEGRGPKEVKGWKTKNKKQLVSRIYLYKKTKTTSSKKGEEKYTKNLDDKQQQKIYSKVNITNRYSRHLTYSKRKIEKI
jgi:hypothetical protein